MPSRMVSNVVPSGSIIQAANTPRGLADTTTTFTKSKAIRVSQGGTYGVQFRLRVASAGGNTITGQIYVNGVARGVQYQAAGAGATSNPIDNFTVNAGDDIQLYVKSNGANAADDFVEGLIIFGSYQNSNIPVVAGKVTTDTDV